MAKKDKEVQEQPAVSANKNDSQRKKAPVKNKRPNVFVRAGRKLKETFSELKRVTWPTFGKALKATGVVLVIVLIFIVVITAINYGLMELLELMINVGV